MTWPTVRPATPDDVSVIHDMIVGLAEYERAPDAVEASAADLHKVLFSAEKSGTGQPAAFAHVAEIDGQVVGFAIWYLSYSTWRGTHGIYLEDLFVRPEFRGSGAGKSLLQRLAQICVERGYSRLEWWVLDWNQPAIDFYLARGAEAMDEWTVYRLTDGPLQDFADGTS